MIPMKLLEFSFCTDTLPSVSRDYSLVLQMEQQNEGNISTTYINVFNLDIKKTNKGKIPFNKKKSSTRQDEHDI